MTCELKRTLGNVDEVSQRYEELGLSKQSVFYGREDEKKKLLECLNFDNKKEKKFLVNVCGMTGIGKSYLVKHAALELMADKRNQAVVIYVDTSGLTSLSNVLAKTLEHPKVECFASGTEDNMIGFFLEFLRRDQQNQRIIVIDDLASPMDNEREAVEIQKFFKKVLETIQSQQLKVKIVITSQQELGKDRSCEYYRNIQNIENLTLDKLDEEASENLLQHLLNTMAGAKRKEELLKYCNGHPTTLHVMCELDSVSLDEISLEVSGETASSAEYNPAEQLFQTAFKRMTGDLQLILLSITLFERDAKLDALHFIVNNSKSNKKDYVQDIKTTFRRRFWLSFKSITSNKAWVQAQRIVVANAYHSSIRLFLKNTLETRLKDHSQRATIIQMKERFIIHHVSSLIDIGKRCLRNPQSACEGLMHDRFNFKTAMSILSSMSPKLLFAKPECDNSYQLRSVEDILHLFLTFFEYHDCLEGQLLKTLDALKEHPDVQGDNVSRVLVSTLHIMALVLNKNWTAIDKELSNMHLEDKVNVIRTTFPESQATSPLSEFCCSIYWFVAAKLYIVGDNSCKHATDAEMKTRRKEYLDDALKALDALPRRVTGPAKYFRVQMLILQAEEIWTADMQNLENIRGSQIASKKAESVAHQVPILKPLAQLEIGDYCTIEGNYHYHKDYPQAEKLYKESYRYLKLALEEFKLRNMETCTVAAKILNSLSVVTCCLANNSSRKPRVSQLSPEEKTKGLEYHRDSVYFAAEAAKAFTVLNSSSKMHLAKTTTQVADSTLLLKQYIQAANIDISEKEKEEDSRVMLQGYIRAYNLILTDHRHCDLTHKSQTLGKVTSHLPEVMKQSKLYSKEEIESVKQQLQVIATNSKDLNNKQEVNKEATLSEADFEERLTRMTSQASISESSKKLKLD